MEPEFAVWCVYHPRDVSPLTLAEAATLLPHTKHMEKLLNYIRRMDPGGVGQTWNEIFTKGGKKIESVMFDGINAVVDDNCILEQLYPTAIEEYILRTAIEFGMLIKELPKEAQDKSMEIYTMGHSETRKGVVELVKQIYKFI